MQVIYDGVRPQGVGSLMRVGSYDGALAGWSDLSSFTKMLLIGGAAVAALVIYNIVKGN